MADCLNLDVIWEEVAVQLLDDYYTLVQNSQRVGSSDAVPTLPGFCPQDGLGIDGSLLRFDVAHSAVSVVLRAITQVLKRLPENAEFTGVRFLDRRGSTQYESVIQDFISTHREVIVKEANKHLEHSSSGVANEPKFKLRKIDNDGAERKFSDLTLLFDVVFDLNSGAQHVGHYVTEVNIKAVREQSSNHKSDRGNTGGLAMFDWAMLGRTPTKRSRRESIADISQAMANSPGEAPVTDYWFWVFRKPEVGDRLITDVRWTSLLSIDPHHESEPLTFNPAQSFPHLQMATWVPTATMAPPPTVIEARTRLWQWWSSHQRAETAAELDLLTEEQLALVVDGLSPSRRAALRDLLA